MATPGVPYHGKVLLYETPCAGSCRLSTLSGGFSPGRKSRPAMWERRRYWRQYRCAMPNDRVERGTSVQSVNRAVSILQVLARHGASQVTQIAAELGVHKS